MSVTPHRCGQGHKSLGSFEVFHQSSVACRSAEQDGIRGPPVRSAMTKSKPVPWLSLPPLLLMYKKVGSNGQRKPLIEHLTVVN